MELERRCSRCTPIRRSTRSRRCSTTAAAPSTARRPPQLLASLHDGAGDVQVVDVRNDGAIPELGADDVVEVPARIDREGAHPLAQGRMAPAMLELVQAVKAFERLAIRAALSGDAEDVRKALEAHPLVGQRIGDVEPLLDALLEANRPYLPRFAAVS